MIVWTEQDTTRSRQRAWSLHVGRHFKKSCTLLCIHGMGGLIRTGQMRHDERWVLRQRNLTQRLPFCVFHPETIHARVQLQSEAVVRQAFHMAYHLVD